MRTEETQNTLQYTLEYEGSKIVAVYLDNVPSVEGGYLSNIRADSCAQLESDGLTVTFLEPWINYTWWQNVTKKITYELKNPRAQYLVLDYDTDYADIRYIDYEIRDANTSVYESGIVSINEIKTKNFIDYIEITPEDIKVRFKNPNNTQNYYITKFNAIGYAITKGSDIKFQTVSNFSTSGEIIDVDNDLICYPQYASAVAQFFAWKFRPARQVKITTWMLPWVLPGNILKLEVGANYDGIYMVTAVTHQGEGGRQPTSTLTLQELQVPDLKVGTELEFLTSKNFSVLSSSELYTSLKEGMVINVQESGIGKYNVYFSSNDELALNNGKYEPTFKKEILAGTVKYQVVQGDNLGQIGNVVGYNTDAQTTSTFYYVLEGPGFSAGDVVEFVTMKLKAAAIEGQVDLNKAALVGGNLKFNANGIQIDNDVVLSENKVPSAFVYSTVISAGEDRQVNMYLPFSLLHKAIIRISSTGSVKLNGTVVTDGQDVTSLMLTNTANTISVSVNEKSKSFVGDGTSKEFDVGEELSTATVKVNSTTKKEFIDYFMNYSSGRLVFATPPSSGDTVEVSYKPMKEHQISLHVVGVTEW